jgi:hypothetical protein
MGQGFHDFRLLWWKICQPPYGAIDSAGKDQNDKKEPKAVRHAQISKSLGRLTQMQPIGHQIKSLGALTPPF